ncbi:MAG: cupin domain-containing protein [Myxococcales bacterium]|nr:cupin domain-containing protein [Myxococcales bacterium]MCB9700952.1 cupin domain-containing protein [Myxococcales bacterium]
MDLKDKGPPSERAALFGGVGVVRVWDLLGRTPAPPFTAVLACTLDPGGSVGRHVQQAFPEIVVGIAGEGEARVGGEPRPLGPGDVVFLALGEVLELRNLRDDAPLEYLIIKARG